MPEAASVTLRPRVREQALPEKHDDRFVDRAFLDKAGALGERAVKVTTLDKLAEGARGLAKWRSLRRGVAAARESVADQQTAAASSSRSKRAKNQATRHKEQARALDKEAEEHDRDADGVTVVRQHLRPALRGSRGDGAITLLAGLVVFAFDLVVSHLVLGETPGWDWEHWVTAALIGGAAVLAGEVLGWITAAGTIDAEGRFHRPSLWVGLVIGGLSILVTAFFVDLGGFRAEALQQIAKELGLSIPDPSFLTLGQIIAFVSSAATCFSYVARGPGRELGRERRQCLAEANRCRDEAAALRAAAEAAMRIADDAPVHRDEAKARVKSRREIAALEGNVDEQQGEYLDPLLYPEYMEARAETEVGILYWRIVVAARTWFGRGIAPGWVAAAALLAGGIVFLLVGSVGAAVVSGVVAGAAVLLAGGSADRANSVAGSEQARAFRAQVDPLAVDPEDRASDITRLVRFESNGHNGNGHQRIDPDDLKGVAHHD